MKGPSTRGTVNLGHISACFTLGQMEHEKTGAEGTVAA